MILSLPDSWANCYRYIGCICRYTCTTLCYIRRKIFGGIENCDLSLPMKKDSEPAIAMTAHALFLAMDNFFRWIVNFSEQSLVRKVAVANFATIAELQIALPWRLRPYPPHTYPTAQEWADSLWFDAIRSNNWRTTPTVCAWTSQPDAQSIANKSVCGYLPEPYTDIGAYVQAWHLWTLSAHTYITHGSPRTQPPEGDCADLEFSKIFVIFM